MDPSGTYIKYDAKAIGSGSEGAQQALQEVYHKVHKKTSQTCFSHFLFDKTTYYVQTCRPV